MADKTPTYPQKKESPEFSGDRYRVFIEDVADGFYETDLYGNFTFFNHAMCRIFGDSGDEILDHNSREGKTGWVDLAEPTVCSGLPTARSLPLCLSKLELGNEMNLTNKKEEGKMKKGLKMNLAWIPCLAFMGFAGSCFADEYGSRASKNFAEDVSEGAKRGDAESSAPTYCEKPEFQNNMEKIST